ncbi:hypothetical protein J7I80_20430 [Bacillus sp. ISL-41]|uniref:DUF5658 family protein n=1 Tax=Bacillus sp. ISL-41 TaxID=2819127 RepID=UPI001BEB897D|nr:DUF5658 family protein [Bacillus sp. ISL-41]MBT2644586.1 hypothetical protein [Bacillus sp. ISL-41]
MTFLFYYLTALNLLDAFITWFGIRNAFIAEFNPIMKAIYETHPMLFVLTKSALSILLILFVLFKIVPRSSLVKFLLLFASVSYSVVVILHGFWLVQIV